MLFDHVSHDREAQTGSTGDLAADPRPVDLVETLEDPCLRRARNPDPVVLDGSHQLVVVATNRHDDLAAARAELHGVMDQVDEDLAKPRLVAANAREAASNIDAEGHPLAIREQPQPFHGRGRETAEIEIV